MWLYVDVEVNEEEVLEKASDKQLIRELESRNFIVNNENDMLDLSNTNLDLPSDKINLIKKILSLRDYNTVDDIIKELNAIK